MPFVLSHQDGTLRKTTKSVVLNLLEEQVEVVTCLVPSALRTVHIIDGMATVQMMKSAGTTTFGELAMKYFTSIVSPLSQSNYSEVHLVFDQYWETSRVENTQGENLEFSRDLYKWPFYSDP